MESSRRDNCKKGNGNRKRETDTKSKGSVVIPYIKNVSEALARVFKKHNIFVTMRPHSTLRRVLVYPKDKIKLEEVCVLYTVYHAQIVKRCT